MRIQWKWSKYWFGNSVYLGVTMFFVLMGAGCARTHRTTTTETTVTTTSSADREQEVRYNRGYIVGAPAEPAVEKSETTTSTTETTSGHRGILSSTVNAIGWVIALPFRLVGGLIGWIF